jgi:hypothetical protein
VNEPDLFSQPAFGGSTFNEALDRDRLTKQLERVKAVMQSGEWYTLAEIAAATGSPEGSIGARLRDLRKKMYGHWNVERRRVSGGLHQYRVNGHKQQAAA